MDFYRISIINTEGLYVKKKGITAKLSIWYCDKTVSSFPHSFLYTFFIYENCCENSQQLSLLKFERLQDTFVYQSPADLHSAKFS